jgi:hypothetical protein
MVVESDRAHAALGCMEGISLLPLRGLLASKTGALLLGTYGFSVFVPQMQAPVPAHMPPAMPKPVPVPLSAAAAVPSSGEKD